MKQFTIKSVLVNNTFATFSASLICDKYILITSHLINSPKPKISKTELGSHKVRQFWVIQAEPGSDHYTTQEAFLLGNLSNKNIDNVLKKYFTDIYDWTNSSSDIIDVFTIYVLSFDGTGSVDELKEIWYAMNNSHIYRGNELEIADEVYIRAAPFGSRQLINSYSQGIISNNVHGILLTDCPTTFGCEGGIILSKTSGRPLGIVISSMVGWRGEWTGLTLGVTFDILLTENANYINSSSTLPTQINVLGRKLGRFLVYVKCGVNWGTGICIDKHNRIILTNAHVITNEDNIEIISQRKSTHAKIIFKVPDHEQFDLTLLKYDKELPDLQTAILSSKQLNEGERILAVGFPLFPHGLNLQPFITKGHVALLKPNVVMTTCIVLPGASGGALFNSKGHVVGIVTCNIMNKDDKCTYPRVNMNIPTHRIAPILNNYLLSKDVKVLERLRITDDCNNNWKISKL